VSNKSALARKREAQEAKRRRKLRLVSIGIGAAVLVVVAAIAAIVYFAVHKDSSPEITDLVKEDLTIGTGAEAEVGKLLTVDYTGWLADGTEFDSSVGGQPFQFTLGQGQVIKGWDAGIKGMRVGGTRRLIIAPELAYGELGREPTIPPNATLTFEVELLAVQ
jgi:FKBP-type peptidyl-prolyl cis-trans isomerase